MASKDFTVSIRRAGACMTDVVIYVDENPALQDEAMALLDAELDKLDPAVSYVGGIYPWKINYELGISARSFSVLEGPAVSKAWVKALTGKFGKLLTVKE